MRFASAETTLPTLILAAPSKTLLQRPNSSRAPRGKCSTPMRSPRILAPESQPGWRSDKSGQAVSSAQVRQVVELARTTIMDAQRAGAGETAMFISSKFCSHGTTSHGVGWRTTAAMENGRRVAAGRIASGLITTRTPGVERPRRARVVRLVDAGAHSYCIWRDH